MGGQSAATASGALIGSWALWVARMRNDSCCFCYLIDGLRAAVSVSTRHDRGGLPVEGFPQADSGDIFHQEGKAASGQ